MVRSSVVALGAAAAVLALAVLVGVVVTLRAGAPRDAPAPGSSVPPADTSSTRLSSPGPQDSYWTPERMRSAEPAPMPTE
ncbi:hypothetical protein [Plantactinospora sp. CA-290183]|uniref:hypothetical protein n=1 Tax=Plantactinospora sp. CA-290183 TaxID=3240006 RepID=UPI003D9442DD